jgi:hypothetical protein
MVGGKGRVGVAGERVEVSQLWAGTYGKRIDGSVQLGGKFQEQGMRVGPFSCSVSRGRPPHSFEITGLCVWA